jgi:glucose-1-phosphate adenylyltransferase
MDYVELLKKHRAYDADVTVATHSVGWGQASRRGLVRVDPDTGLVENFQEKPTGDRLEAMAHASKHATPTAPFEASMGVYIFKRDVLVSLLHENEGHFGSDAGPDTHFGHDVMPHALREGYTVVAHHFDGYWRELAGLRDFYEANLELAAPNSPISIFDVDKAIVSRGRILPPSIVHQCEIYDSLVGEGSILMGSTLRTCIVGSNSYIGRGCDIQDTIILGNDSYTNEASRALSRKKGEVVLGIGENTVIKNAVVDSNAAIGRNVRITNAAGVVEGDNSQAGYVIQDGITVVLKGAIIADNAKI